VGAVHRHAYGRGRRLGRVGEGLDGLGGVERGTVGEGSLPPRRPDGLHLLLQAVTAPRGGPTKTLVRGPAAAPGGPAPAHPAAAASSAVLSGFDSGRTWTAVPIFKRVVRMASAEAMTSGAARTDRVGLKWISASQMASKPYRSAASACAKISSNASVSL